MQKTKIVENTETPSLAEQLFSNVRPSLAEALFGAELAVVPA